MLTIRTMTTKTVESDVATRPGSGTDARNEDEILAAHPDSEGDEETALGIETEKAEAEGEPEEVEPETDTRETKVAIIGHPNVGKSTLLNALTGTSRAIVSPIAGTTRDAVDEVVEKDGKIYRFIDTAGIRRKGKTD